MAPHHLLVRDNGSLDLGQLAEYQQKPALFTPGEPLFWDDPHISSQMLAVHLDPDTDLASRKAATIYTSVAWIIETLGLQAGEAVLDLGCGPGLYAARLAQHGLAVSGVDYAQRSIAYAREYAAEHGLAIEYRCQNYLTLADENLFDAILLIFGDYCTFPPEDRLILLGNVHRALRPGGHFILDVSTRVLRDRYGLKNGWYVSQGGFWRPGPHMVLEQGFDYPQQAIWLDQYIIIEPGGNMTVYRNWFQDYDRVSIIEELVAGGFDIQSVWGDLTGTPYSEEGEWIGLVAKHAKG
jgi:SAM-dependent methyltransferase